MEENDLFFALNLWPINFGQDCYVINNKRLKIEFKSFWTIYYYRYFIRCEHKLPNISLFSETCDYTYSGLGIFLTFNKYSFSKSHRPIVLCCIGGEELRDNTQHHTTVLLLPHATGATGFHITPVVTNKLKNFVAEFQSTSPQLCKIHNCT